MSGEACYLLDTNILIGLLKGTKPALTLLESIEHDSKLFYSAVTRMELLGFSGISAEETEQIESVLANLIYVSINRPIPLKIAPSHCAVRSASSFPTLSSQHRRYISLPSC